MAERTQQAYDVVVVGGGAAGLSAALVLARCLRRVVVVDAGRPRNAAAAHLHNFLTRDGMPPAEFLAAARAEVAGYGVEILTGTVRAVDRTQTGFTVVVEDGPMLLARRVLAATGLTDELPDLPGIHQRWGRDVLHCPYCHGYEVRGRPLGILAESPMAVHMALQLGQWSPDVVLFRHTLPDSDVGEQERAALAARDVRIVEGRVTGLVVENDQLTGVRLVDGTVVARSALFVASRPVPRDAVLTALGATTEQDTAQRRWVSTDPMGRTSVPGAWAVGNVARPAGQLVTFAADGTLAAIGLNADLVSEDITLAQAARHTPVAVSSS
ncbi:MAG: NAD(P)/FAD-dependent oxidoreductase [Frankia sp.]